MSLFCERRSKMLLIVNSARLQFAQIIMICKITNFVLQFHFSTWMKYICSCHWIISALADV